MLVGFHCSSIPYLPELCAWSSSSSSLVAACLEVLVYPSHCKQLPVASTQTELAQFTVHNLHSEQYSTAIVLPHTYISSTCSIYRDLLQLCTSWVWSEWVSWFTTTLLASPYLAWYVYQKVVTVIALFLWQCMQSTQLDAQTRLYPFNLLLGVSF